MAEFYVRKVFGQFEAADEPSYEIMKTYKQHEVYRAKIWKPRDLVKHRKAFILLNNIVFPNQDKYNSVEALRYELTIRAGFYDLHTTLKGKLVPMPKSWKFDKMDDIEFKELWSKIIDVILKYFLVGSTEEEIEKEVLRILDFE